MLVVVLVKLEEDVPELLCDRHLGTLPSLHLRGAHPAHGSVGPLHNHADDDVQDPEAGEDDQEEEDQAGPALELPDRPHDEGPLVKEGDAQQGDDGPRHGPEELVAVPIVDRLVPDLIQVGVEGREGSRAGIAVPAVRGADRLGATDRDRVDDDKEEREDPEHGLEGGGEALDHNQEPRHDLRELGHAEEAQHLEGFDDAA
mmetsp:Transcript_49913/g.131917  ORF Transcript_49913/g.131917 Transcript_49913/m.131917 type:complete len:201 (-) Transcript_49913:128-730(-)